MEKLKFRRMKVVDDNDGSLRLLFADKSYALVRSHVVSGFVHIIPRHMTDDNWRELFWLGIDELVLHGRKYKDLCSVCTMAMTCVNRGVGIRPTFECEASAETIDIEKTLRKKGEESCPR